jgi:hypothetical protein
MYQSCVQTCIAAGGSCAYTDALKARYDISDYNWRYDLSLAVDIHTCSTKSACSNLIYKKNVWGYELNEKRECFYGDRNRVCSTGVPSNYSAYLHRKLCPCTLFVCNGSYTVQPSPKPIAPSAFPISSAPSFRPSISLEPSNTAIPTVQVQWVLGLSGQSCAATCANVRRVDYHHSK